MSDKKVLQVGAFMIGLAILLRLTAGVWAPVIQTGEPIQAEQVFLFLQTGRVVPLPTVSEVTQEMPLTQAAPPAAMAVFSQSDQELIQLRNTSDKAADISAALLENLQWDLYTQRPSVLILHSHGSESYENTGEYAETSAYRTLNTDYNMICIGDHLAQKLEQSGIQVIHDRTMYDVPSYNDAYVNARSAIEKHLEANPSICLVLDLHRDAAATDSGQIRYAVDTQKGTAAQLMLVLGTNHEGWQDNLSFATKLHVQLEKQAPGICRPISVRAQRYNQDLCPAAVLVEVGAAGNSRQEALLGAEYLASAIISLAAGAHSS